jgi:hypothetical protein
VAADVGVAGSAALVLVEGVVPLRPEPALFEAMIEGWRRQQSARRLSAGVVDDRERLVRRFQEFNRYTHQEDSYDKRILAAFDDDAA